MLPLLKAIAHSTLTCSPKERCWFSRFDLIVFLLIVGAIIVSLIVPTSHSPKTNGATFHGTGRGGVETTTINIDPTPPPFKLKQTDVTDPATNLTHSTLPTNDNGNGSLINSKNGLLVVTNPAVTSENPQVRTIWWVMIAIVYAFIFLLFIVAGYRVMMGAVGFRYADALESIPRILLALLGASFSLVFVSFFIALDNSLCHVVSDAVDRFGLIPATFGFPSSNDAIQNVGNILKTIASVFIGGFDGNNLIGAILVIVIFVFLLMVSVQLFVRLALLNLLIMLSPLGFACWALPQGGGQQLTKLWMNAFFATVMVQFLQWTCYAGGSAAFAGLNATIFGGIGLPSPTLQVTEVAILWLVLKIPGWLGNTVVSTMGEGSRAVSSTISQTVSAIQSIISTATLVLK